MDEEKNVIKSRELKEYDISKELWREYDWVINETGQRTVVRINKPQKLFLYSGCTTHRVVDSEGIVHCLPSVGLMGCVLRWFNSDLNKPCNF